MSVNNLENQERGVNLQTRRAKQTEDDIMRAVETVTALRARVVAAKDLTMPKPIHCSDCAQAWADGRDAAIKAIEGE